MEKKKQRSPEAKINNPSKGRKPTLEQTEQSKQAAEKEANISAFFSTARPVKGFKAQ